MEKLNLIFIALMLIFSSCKKDSEPMLNVSIEESDVNFIAKAGGAIMEYNIPEDNSVSGICVEYVNEKNEKRKVIGTPFSRSLEIKGFNNPQTNAIAKIYYIGVNQEKSKLIEMKFSTLASSAVSIFESLEVNDFWSGFEVSYDAPREPNGFINIGYVGTNPTTNSIDDILTSSMAIKPGKNTYRCSDFYGLSSGMTAVVWTEDFNGNLVARKEYNFTPILTELIDGSRIKFIGSSNETPAKQIGSASLFDGDLKGVKFAEGKENNDYNTCNYFITKEIVSSKPEMIFDIGKPEILTSFRVYIPIRFKNPLYQTPAQLNISRNILNNFKLFASNDKDDDGSWVDIGEFYQSPNIIESLWWCAPLTNAAFAVHSLEDLYKAKPCYVEIIFNRMSDKYRYIKLEPISTFGGISYPVLIQEVEVYIAKHE